MSDGQPLSMKSASQPHSSWRVGRNLSSSRIRAIASDAAVRGLDRLLRPAPGPPPSGRSFGMARTARIFPWSAAVRAITSFIVDAAAGSGFARISLDRPEDRRVRPATRTSIGPLIASDTAVAVASSMFPSLRGYRMILICATSKSCFDQSAASGTHPVLFACVADADLVIDIAVRDRHVGQHEVSEIESARPSA